MPDHTIESALDHLSATGTHEVRKYVRILRRLLKARLAEKRFEILDSHVVELIELLKYDGRENLVADVALTGETIDHYQQRTDFCARCGNPEGDGVHYMGPGLIQTSAHHFESQC